MTVKVGSSINFRNQKLGTAYSNQYYRFKDLVFVNYSDLINLNDYFSLRPEIFTYFYSTDKKFIAILDIGFKEHIYLGYLNNSLFTNALRILYTKKEKIDYGLMLGFENRSNEINMVSFNIRFNV